MLEQAAKLTFRTDQPELEAELCAVGVPQFASQILAKRGVNAEQLAAMKPNLALLPGINGGSAAAAAKLLASKITANKSIMVIGDYDADGICATAIMFQALTELGANCSYQLVDSSAEIRGLSAALVKQAAKAKADTIVTVDNGISAIEAVAVANQLGITVIITDHHIATDQLPEAAAMANPQLPNSGFPSQKICGAVVSLLVMREVVRLLGSKLRMTSMLDLAAVATIADMMPLNETYNRQIVSYGLYLIKRGRCSVGIKAILGDSKLKSCTSSTLSFRLIPSLNAAGRIDNPATALKCLLAKNIGEANELASKLKSINNLRRTLTNALAEEAANQLAKTADLNNNFSFVHLLDDIAKPVTGLIANQLVDEHGRPAVVVCGNQAPYRGSMRSPASISVYDVITKINLTDSNMFKAFGGHPCAAGFSLNGDIDKFKSYLVKYFAEAKPRAVTKQPIDAVLTVFELKNDSLNYLVNLPWGYKFEEPLFYGEFELGKARVPNSGNGFMYSAEDDKIQVWSAKQLAVDQKTKKSSFLFRMPSTNYNGKPAFIFVDEDLLG